MNIANEVEVQNQALELPRTRPKKLSPWSYGVANVAGGCVGALNSYASLGFTCTRAN